MKIAVLNGSPKGLLSATIQYIHYIQKKYTQHQLNIINISQIINKIEKDENVFKKIMDDIRTSDGVLWSFPIYNCVVPSQYKRFIELIWERGEEKTFKDKYTASLSTSSHLLDNPAHTYMAGICCDLDMIFIDYYLYPDHDDDSIFVFAYNEKMELLFWGTSTDLRLSKDRMKNIAGKNAEIRHCLKKRREEYKDREICKKLLYSPSAREKLIE